MRLNEAKNIINYINNLNEISLRPVGRALGRVIGVGEKGANAAASSVPGQVTQSAEKTSTLGKIGAGIGAGSGILFGIDSAMNIGSAAKDAFKTPPPPSPSAANQAIQRIKNAGNAVRSSIIKNPGKVGIAAGIAAAGTTALALAAKNRAEKNRREKCAKIEDLNARRACLNNE